MKKALLFPAVLFAISVHSQEVTESDRSRADALTSLSVALEAHGATQATFEAYDVPLAASAPSYGDDEWLATAEAVERLARYLDATADVTVATSDGDGATIKYQTLGERRRGMPPVTASSLTEVVETMYLGLYHIWSERGGVTTSDTNAQYRVDDRDERIVLEEY